MPFWKKIEKYCWLLSVAGCILTKLLRTTRTKTDKEEFQEPFLKERKWVEKSLKKLLTNFARHDKLSKLSQARANNSKTKWTLITKQYNMQSSLKNICNTLKFFNEYNIWKDGSLRTEIHSKKRKNSQVLFWTDLNFLMKQLQAIVLTRIPQLKLQDLKHESLILAQDERWRRA